MWTVVKYKNNYFGVLKKKLIETLGDDTKFYTPTIKIRRFRKNKFVQKDLSLLGDYFFCYSKKFENENIIQSLKYLKGLKYFLSGFNRSQLDIKNFISKCKESEDKDGYLSNNFIKLCIDAKYKFTSGPFIEIIFKIIELQRNSMKILLGNFETTIKKKEYFFTRV